MPNKQLSTLEILLELERLFSTKNDLSSKGLCYALWQGFKPPDHQCKLITELLWQNSGLSQEDFKNKFYSYWWLKGDRKPRLETIQRTIKNYKPSNETQ